MLIVHLFVDPDISEPDVSIVITPPPKHSTPVSQPLVVKKMKRKGFAGCPDGYVAKTPKIPVGKASKLKAAARKQPRKLTPMPSQRVTRGKVIERHSIDLEPENSDDDFMPHTNR